MLEKNINNDQQNLDVSGLAPGFYMLNITDKTGYRKVQKIIIK